MTQAGLPPRPAGRLCRWREWLCRFRRIARGAGQFRKLSFARKGGFNALLDKLSPRFCLLMRYLPGSPIKSKSYGEDWL